MAHAAGYTCRRYSLHGLLPSQACLTGTALKSPLLLSRGHSRATHTITDPAPSPLDTLPSSLHRVSRKHKKQDRDRNRKPSLSAETLGKWRLTVGIEIHAQLNTPRKLFSTAASASDDAPNSHVALFDVAMPGSLPTFQKETLIPAIRGALALRCKIEHRSQFDRKHYFHWDQPAGFQITQYYKPFAKGGYVTLYAQDGIAAEDGESVTVGIKQVQIEQDTAKTITQPSGEHYLDFNRAGLPLIEIITLPQIHHPTTAAALVRKVQHMLNAVDSCVLGMESGGLRADVNVSVHPREGKATSDEEAVASLGQRTEIKNLNSFKSVEDAIIAERDRQIGTLEAGEPIIGETRGWSIDSTETHPLRLKEGEVDYRYMPDPELGPIVIDQALIDHLQNSLGVLPDEELTILTEQYGISLKDALSLQALENGGRVEYVRDVVDALKGLQPQDDLPRLGRICSNWILHEMGGLVMNSSGNSLHFTAEGGCLIPATAVAEVLHLLDSNHITMRTAKRVLTIMFNDATTHRSISVKKIVDDRGLWYTPLLEQEYDALAESIQDQAVLEQIIAGKNAKRQYLVGQIMRQDCDGRTDPLEARKAVDRLVERFKSRAASSV